MFLDGTGNWSSPGGGVTDITATAPLNADVATGSVTLSMPAYATATGGYVPSGGATNQYLDGLSGSWTTLPVSGVIGVAGDSVTISSTGGTTPIISAITTAGVSSISTSLATGAQIQSAIDTALSGTLTFKGTFNATTGQITSGINNGSQLYTGTAGVIAITKGDFYIADTAGSFYNTTAMNVGDEAIALFTVAAAPPGSAITDWSVIPSQSAGGTVTGTGAATQVTFWDGTSNINGDTAFNWDNTNKRLGIGTASPAKKLHVDSGSQSDIARFQNDNGFFTLGQTASQTSLDLAASNVFRIRQGGTIPFYIKSDGNVGIGTTSPSAKLDVRGEALVGDGTDGVKLTYSTGNSTGIIDTGYSSTGLEFRTGGTERMRISSSGAIKFNAYGGGTNTGTAAYSLAVDSSGNIIEEAAGGGGASTITTNNFPGNATVGPFTLGAAPSGGSKSFVDVFIDGVYQEITTYGVTGTALTFVVGSEPPTGTNIETKTTSGNVSGALVSSVDIGQSTSTTGGVNLRINPIEVPSGTTPTGIANSLYIFTATGAQSISTLTLPGSPTLGDSIKISNLGGLANVLGANGNKIMGVAADMTINTPTAAFEIIWSGSNNGWIIIGNV